MGLFDKLFENKYCSICGNAVSILGSRKLKDGCCCKSCESLFSPYFTGRKQSTVLEIKYQVECRKRNAERLRDFCVTRTIGSKTKVLIDEGKGQFVVATSKNFRMDNVDVIDCSCVTDCTVDIVESRKEIKYQDSNGNIKSFSPPSYAYSYDFYIEIDVSIPYIDIIRFKINDDPIDNNQETLIKMEGGLLRKLTDALYSSKSNNGMTSNANEVRGSAQYQKCEQIAGVIRDTLLSHRTVKKDKDTCKNTRIVCPWCGMKVPQNDEGICNRCGGTLED